jgi:hypothetical protein
VHLVSDLDSGEENLVCKFSFAYIFSDMLQQYNEKAGFKGPLANISCCMHLLRCELSLHCQPVSMASPPMAEKDKYAMAHCLDEQSPVISIPR